MKTIRKFRPKTVQATVALASLAVIAAGCGTTAAADFQSAAGQTPSAMAQMAERLFPSGTSNVVLISDTKSGQGLAGPASDLAAHMGGALLEAQSVNHLGFATRTALNDMAIPSVAPSSVEQPFQPTPGKPAVTIVGGTDVISNSLQSKLESEGYSVSRISGNGNQITRSILNQVAPAVPTSAPSFPSSWSTYASSADHNSVFKLAPGAPSWERTGVSWNFAEMAAVPFNRPFPDLANLGLRGAPVKMTQDLGNAVGVSAVNGIIYAESDDGHVYALDARTGQELWQTGQLANTPMGNPIVENNTVFVTVGDTGFPFSQLLKYELSGGTAPLVRGLGWSAVYAFNATTGREIWRADFHGNAMPTPVYYGGNLYVPTGGGTLWAFDAATGAVKWKTAMGGFDSMSSPSVYINPTTHQAEIVVGTSDANHLVAVDASTGKILWEQPTTLNIFNTGMGDNSPAIDQAKGIIIQDSVVNFDRANKTTNLAAYAMNASTGAVLWSTYLGVGPTPPAYKAGVAMIHNGVVYIGSPVTSSLYALNESTGQILWKTSFPNAGPAGAGRGAAAYAYGTLWIAAGPTIYAIDPATGKVLSTYSPGGRFGIVNPVIVGGTMYLDNSYDWVQAVPLAKIYPSVNLNR
jgi:outer membrane protein assembly factor BamB